VAETTDKNFCAAGFDALVKQWNKYIYQCWWRICREINVLARFEYHIFYVLYQFVPYLLTVPRNSKFAAA
jgi:hypothetical protein